MLEQLRNSSGSFVIWVLFAIIIAAFVLFFGSPTDQLGCGSTKAYSINVKDKQVSDHSWRFAYNGIPFVMGNIPGNQRKPLALELLLQREILAQAAEKLDILISDEKVDEAIRNGELYLMGNKLDGTAVYFEGEAPSAFFSFDYLTNLVTGRLGLPGISTYKQEQKREMMAYHMKEIILQSAFVSEEEAKQNFIAGNSTISAQYAKFDIARYRDALTIDEKDLQEYAKTHEVDLKNEWERVSARWETEKPRVAVRIIKVNRAPKAAKTTTKTEESLATKTEESLATKTEESIATKTEESIATKTEESIATKTEESIASEETETKDPAHSKIAAARAEIVAGANFATIAEKVSTDRTKHLGGRVGWRDVGAIGYGAEVAETAQTLDDGAVSEIISTDKAYFLLLIEERSDKGLSYEQKQLDLAQKLAPDAIARDHAKAAAEKALAEAQITPLDRLFPKETKRAPMDLSSLSPEIRAQLGPEQLQQLAKGLKINNSVDSEDKTTTDDSTTSDDLPAPPIVKDFGVARPDLASITGVTRNSGLIAGLGRSPKLAKDLFGTLAVNTVAPTVYEVSESPGFVIIQLTDRTEADMEKFSEQVNELQSALALSKGARLLQNWVSERCEALSKNGSITPNYSLLVTGAEGRTIPYEPCSLLTQTGP